MATSASAASPKFVEATVRHVGRLVTAAARRGVAALLTVLESSELGPGLPASVYFRHCAERAREFGEFGAPYDPAHEPALKSGDDRPKPRA